MPLNVKKVTKQKKYLVVTVGFVLILFRRRTCIFKSPLIGNNGEKPSQTYALEFMVTSL